MGRARQNTNDETIIKTFKPMNQRQFDYMQAICENQITFAIGGPGTAKSYVAIAKGLSDLFSDNIDKLIITRPTEEISPQGLGFIPGTLNEKYYLFVKPMENIILEIINKELYQKLVREEKIVFEPLEYMLGSTFPKRSLAILDECEQCDIKQIRMFLTRIGGGKIVINGDQKQVYHKKNDSLTKVVNALKNIDDVAVIDFLPQDTVRDPLISLICERIDNIL